MKWKVLLYLSLFTGQLFGQKTDTLEYSLPEALVMGSSITMTNPFEIVLHLPPSPAIDPNLNYINRMGINLLKYGAGQLSTLTWHGLPGASTGVYWNDILINDPLTGQMDASGMFLSMMGNSLTFSTVNSLDGLPGGQLRFSSMPTLDSSGWTSRINGLGGQYGLRSGQGSISYSNGRTAFSAFGGALIHQNNFPYEENGQSKLLEHGNRSFYGYGAGIQKLLRKFWRIETSFLLTNDDKNIPPRLFQQFSDAHLTNTRSLFSSKLSYEKKHAQCSFGLSSSNLSTFYVSPSAHIDFKGKTWLGISNFSYRYTSGARYWLAKVQGRTFQAESTGFNQKILANDLILSSEFGATTHKMNLRFSFRNQFSTDRNRQLVTFLFSLHRALSPQLKLIFSTGKYGRIPSFNDLYWAPGGRPDLLPEKGWGADMRWKWTPFGTNTVQWSLFHRRMLDYIQWIPQNGIFSVVNIPSVWSRGIDLDWKYEMVEQLVWTLHYGFAKTTYSSNRLPNDNVVGKQLIYVPLHQGTNRVDWMMSSQWKLVLEHQWSGKRFVTADNEIWLPSYHVFNAGLSYTVYRRKVNAVIGVAVDNLTDQSYQIIRGWLLPGRVFKMNIDINLN